MQRPHLQNGETNSPSTLGLYSQQKLATELACAKHLCCAHSRRAPSCFQTSSNSHPKLLALASSHSTLPCSYHSLSVLEHTTSVVPMRPRHALSPKALPLCSHGHAFWCPNPRSLTISVLRGPSEHPFHLLPSGLCVPKVSWQKAGPSPSVGTLSVSLKAPAPRPGTVANKHCD